MQDIRNIAIIAHVDHGKTTLVDRILHQVKTFRENEETGDLILDNNDLERERGITILSKNVSVRYKGVKINIIDTPGHSDFGGEVERVLNMADGCLLLVDAFEGPMPQTRFVLEKAIEMNLKPIVVVNKVDKPNCDPEGANEAVFDLMCNLNATEDQLDFRTVYGSSKIGWMGPDWRKPTSDFTYLLDTILEVIPAPKQVEGTTQMRITSLDYSSYIGRIAVGRIARGTLIGGQNVSLVKRDGTIVKSKIKELYTFEGLGKEKIKTEVQCGEICAIVGLEGFDIGDTVADFENPEALPAITIDEPTMSMVFTNNDSPFFGKEGKFVTSRHLRERLYKELEKNLALRIEETGAADRAERGNAFPFVQKCEPMEQVTVHVPERLSGKVIELITQRKGEMKNMISKNDRVHLEFTIPSRGLIGLTSSMLTATEGEAVISHIFTGFEPWKGEMPNKNNGALIAMETGQTFAYAIDKLQDRGTFFIEPGEEVYAGQVIGEHVRENDLVINVCKSKKLTNMRASGSDEKVAIAPAKKMSLEECMEYIRKDEYLEVTPKSLRLRKIILDENERKREKKSAENN